MCVCVYIYVYNYLLKSVGIVTECIIDHDDTNKCSIYPNIICLSK